MIQRPIELDGVVDKSVLHNATTVFSADIESAVGAKRVNDNDVIGEVFDGIEAAANIRFFVVSQQNDCDGRGHVVDVLERLKECDERIQLSVPQVLETNQQAFRTSIPSSATVWSRGHDSPIRVQLEIR